MGFYHLDDSAEKNRTSQTRHVTARLQVIALLMEMKEKGIKVEGDRQRNVSLFGSDLRGGKDHDI